MASVSVDEYLSAFVLIFIISFSISSGSGRRNSISQPAQSPARCAQPYYNIPFLYKRQRTFKAKTHRTKANLAKKLQSPTNGIQSFSSTRQKHKTIYYICDVRFIKKILITFLCLQIILPNQLVQDIVRLPVLVAHYLQHNHTDHHIHFTDFISDHYSDHEHHDKDHKNHNNLPFHNHHFNFQQSIFTVVILDIFPSFQSNYGTANSKIKIISRQHFHSSTALSSIWRPPKFA